MARKNTYVAAGDGDDDRIYVRLPVPPEVVAAVREHVENGRELLGMLLDLNGRAGGVVAAVTKAARAVDRDVQRLKRARKRR